ncbi:hypothetical protein CH1034_90025 [Klebsiella pneumoniae]|nr:hypothetical protein CH1034_90025 [Klebsiella pneumoniae]
MKIQSGPNTSNDKYSTWNRVFLNMLPHHFQLTVSNFFVLIALPHFSTLGLNLTFYYLHYIDCYSINKCMREFYGK